MADKAWLQRREKSERTERQRRQAWAEVNYRMNVAGETLSTLFGDDLCSIIPVYPTKVGAGCCRTRTRWLSTRWLG